ncbi:CAP domain-containing protein [Salibacterium halotolerans]|uniref:Uncharacterized protein, YkwD family n=1 Tax=Salibacterium halotolerans TaxID=1884432 RepID=A0A1I5PA10_9BACI|nr:CAP domain-containing protein [Salibacterium halotolerans]SFP30630.1 uncharacterized protein, YkwD family [Salibacterium halotolerans]
MIKKSFVVLVCLLLFIVVVSPVTAQDIWKWKSPKESYEKVTENIKEWTRETDIQQTFQDWTTNIESFLNSVEWQYPGEAQKEEGEPEQSSPDKEASVSGESITDYEPGEFEREVLKLVNEERAKRELEPLEMHNRLSGLADIKSQDMAENNYFSHTSPTYGSPFDMMEAFDFTYRAAGENIAAGQRSPEQVVEGWMNSEGHRDNILHKDFTHMGVGYVEQSGPYHTYWTQLFMTPR